MNSTRYSLLAMGAMLALAGCSTIQRDPPLQVWPDMRFQKKFKPQRSTDLFPDQRFGFGDGGCHSYAPALAAAALTAFTMC